MKKSDLEHLLELHYGIEVWQDPTLVIRATEEYNILRARIDKQLEDYAIEHCTGFHYCVSCQDTYPCDKENGCGEFLPILCSMCRYNIETSNKNLEDAVNSQQLAQDLAQKLERIKNQYVLLLKKAQSSNSLSGYECDILDFIVEMWNGRCVQDGNIRPCLKHDNYKNFNGIDQIARKIISND